MILDEAVYLEHFGVKGMKWGVRNAKLGGDAKVNTGDDDIVLDKGTKVYNISARTQRDIKDQVYAAYKTKDVLNYRGAYASDQSVGLDKQGKLTDVPVFSNAFTVPKGINAAGRQAQLATFKAVWDKDPNGMARALAESRKDTKFSAAFNFRILKLDRDNVYHKRIMEKGEKWVTTKGLQEFNMSLAITQKTIDSQTSKRDIGRKANEVVKQKYFKELQKRGYNAVVDLNDIKNYGSETPLLIFKGNNTLKRSGKAIKLTSKDMEKAAEVYLSEKKLKEYRETLHI